MDFRLLGSLEVWDGNVQIEIGGAKRRAVLALLLLHANEVVGTDQLIDELWGERAPKNAAASLHNHVSRLRKVLGPDLLATRAWGYVLRCDPERIDLHRFERLVADAEPLPARERSARLAEALGLWRGPALADLLFEPALAKEVTRLEELRLAALEARADADLELGRNAEIIGELDALVAKHPLRERVRGQLILALYRDGRQAEALEVYRETRRLLATELGLEPSPALRELERAVLRHDPSIAPVASASVTSEDPTMMRRKWLVYAALAGGTVLAAGGIAAFAALRSGKPAHPVPAAAAAAPTHAGTSHRAALAQPLKQSRRVSAPQSHTRRAARNHAAAKPKLAAASRSSSPVARTRSRAAHTRQQQKPQTRNSSKPPPSKPASNDVRITDDFLADTADPQIWTVGTNGTGVDVTQGNGRLEITMHADATPVSGWPSFSGYYVTKCSFAGDFDASVDYALVDWPAANGTTLALDLVFATGDIWIGRESFSSAEVYDGMSGYRWSSLPTTDVRGALRIKRVGSRLYSYYRNLGKWSGFASINYGSDPVRLRLIFRALGPEFAQASGNEFAHKDVTVAFENFVVEAPPPSCS